MKYFKRRLCSAFSVPLTEAGYKEAIRKLESKYLKTDEIQDNIFHFIHTFSVTNTGKNHSTLRSKLVALENYIDELTSSHGFEMNTTLCKFIGHIIMKGLPNDVKKYFSWESGTLYPDYNDILSQKI